MAINKKLIHFKKREYFDTEVANNNIPDYSICFIQDTKEIYTHGQLYSCNVDASTLTNVLRVDENGEVNKDKLVVSGEYLNDNYETVSYNYGNQDNTLQFSHLWSTSSNHNLTSVTMKDTIEIASLKSYGGTDLYDGTHMNYAGLQAYEGRCELASVKLSDNGFLTGGILAEEGSVYTQAHDFDVEGYPSKMSGIATASDKVYIASIQYVPTQISTELTVTPEGVFINNNPVITAANIDKAVRKMINVTYQELKQLRDSSQLVPGQYYRITDYVTTTTESNTASAGHQFDVIVLALDRVTLAEEAWATHNENESYFVNSNLSAWKLWYSLDNDTGKFIWADENNGKGVIYRMIDEKNNDLPYDFKNILFGEVSPVYEVNDRGLEISLENPLEISYTLLTENSFDYNGKYDHIVELDRNIHPDTGEETWVLYKTDLDDFSDEVDYDDMFVFIDKYYYNGQYWDRWRKAEFDGEESYQWVSHNGSALYILTEELLDIVDENITYRYTFNIEEFNDELDQADASVRGSDSDTCVSNNSMKPYSNWSPYYTVSYALPWNVFQINDSSYYIIANNHFDVGCYNNTFEEICECNIFNTNFSHNKCYRISHNVFGLSCCYNTFYYVEQSIFGNVVQDSEISGGYINSQGELYKCVLYGYNINLDYGVYYLTLSGFQVHVKSLESNESLIEIPDHSYTLTVAQNSRGEIKIYNEADLIA